MNFTHAFLMGLLAACIFVFSFMSLMSLLGESF